MKPPRTQSNTPTHPTAQGSSTSLCGPTPMRYGSKSATTDTGATHRVTPDHPDTASAFPSCIASSTVCCSITTATAPRPCSATRSPTPTPSDALLDPTEIGGCGHRARVCRSNGTSLRPLGCLGLGRRRPGWSWENRQGCAVAMTRGCASTGLAAEPKISWTTTPIPIRKRNSRRRERFARLLGWGLRLVDWSRSLTEARRSPPKRRRLRTTTRRLLAATARTCYS
jgi:hypothetical protein